MAAATGRTDRICNGLQQRRSELESDEQHAPAPFTASALARLAAETSAIIRGGNTRQRRSLLQALVAEIRVDSRDRIQPIFYTPAVRPLDGSVRPA